MMALVQRWAEPRDGRDTRLSRGEAWFTVLALVVILAVMVFRAGTTQSPTASVAQFPPPPLLALGLLAWCPLLLRARWPLAAFAACAAVDTVIIVVAPHLGDPHPMAAYQPAPLATVIAVYAVGSRLRHRRVAWIAGGTATAVQVAAGLLFHPGSYLATDGLQAELIMMSTALGALAGMRWEAAARTERERRERVVAAVTDERLRIARELHDVLAHSLALVNAQAGVAEYLLRTDPDKAADALRGIAGQTARAIDELRATVGLLREPEADPTGSGAPGAADDSAPHPDPVPWDPAQDDPHAPIPGLAVLPDLVRRFRRAGLDADVKVSGPTRELTAQTDLAAYRIVQESLTNATKHAATAHVRVHLTWTARDLTVVVANDPPSSPVRRHAPGTGNGMIGMRERAVSAGGTLEAGPTDSGGFVVRAVLPTREETR